MFNFSKFNELFKASEMTGAELAETLHLSQSVVNLWLEGKKEPYPACIRQLCELFVCERSDLVSDSVAALEPVINKQPVKKDVAGDKNGSVKKPEATEPISETTPVNDVSSAGEPVKAVKHRTRHRVDITPSESTFAGSIAVQDMSEAKPDIKPAAEPATKTKTIISKEDNTAMNDEKKPARTRKPKNVSLSEQIAVIEENVAKLKACAENYEGLGNIDARVRNIIKEAATASDEGLAMALSILKNYKKR